MGGVNTLIMFGRKLVKNGMDWFQEGSISAYNIDISGGGDNHTYYVSGGWNDENGIVDYNWKRGLNGRASAFSNGMAFEGMR